VEVATLTSRLAIMTTSRGHQRTPISLKTGLRLAKAVRGSTFCRDHNMVASAAPSRRRTSREKESTDRDIATKPMMTVEAGGMVSAISPMAARGGRVDPGESPHGWHDDAADRGNIRKLGTDT